MAEFERRHKKEHPKGFEPGLKYDGRRGTITTGPLDKEPDDSIWSQLIEDWGLDPNRTQVVPGSIQIRAWDTLRDGETVRLKYYRATIEPREGVISADLDDILRYVKSRKPKSLKSVDADRAFLVLLSDWQLGKGAEIGGGTPQTTERILGALDGAVARFRELSRIGKRPSVVYLIGLGDLVEACWGHYPAQPFTADLSNREQDKLARWLILKFIDAFVDLGVPIVCMGVPGNHGEARVNGKMVTNFLDNRDFSAFETVAEIIAQSDRYENVHMPVEAINGDDLTLTLDLCGVPVSFAHGHQFRSGTTSQAKAENWWKGQALGRTAVSDAEILCCGHLHHFMQSESSGRTVIQVPAMDGGSRWFTATSGASSQAGMVTLLVGANQGSRGWSDLQIV